MLTPLADIRTVCTLRHCHEVVEANAIRAADDHMLSPQAGFLWAQYYPHSCQASVNTFTQKYIDGGRGLANL
jgi:hypothetical protein